MSTLVVNNEVAAVEVSCDGDDLKVVLADGRTVSAPLAWFPRLLTATPKQRVEWELIGGGIGIHWEVIDEDILVASLLQAGKLHAPSRRAHHYFTVFAIHWTIQSCVAAGSRVKSQGS